MSVLDLNSWFFFWAVQVFSVFGWRVQRAWSRHFGCTKRNDWYITIVAISSRPSESFLVHLIGHIELARPKIPGADTGEGVRGFQLSPYPSSSIFKFVLFLHVSPLWSIAMLIDRCLCIFYQWNDPSSNIKNGNLKQHLVVNERILATRLKITEGNTKKTNFKAQEKLSSFLFPNAEKGHFTKNKLVQCFFPHISLTRSW